jgi:hypothetical protein
MVLDYEKSHVAEIQTDKKQNKDLVLKLQQLEAELKVEKSNSIQLYNELTLKNTQIDESTAKITELTESNMRKKCEIDMEHSTNSTILSQLLTSNRHVETLKALDEFIIPSNYRPKISLCQMSGNEVLYLFQCIPKPNEKIVQQMENHLQDILCRKEKIHVLQLFEVPNEANLVNKKRKKIK